MNAPNRKYSAWRKPQVKWMLIGLLAVVAFMLWTEYRAYALGALPYLLLLLCPLMHLFHRGHGHHGQGHHGPGHRKDSGGRDTGRLRTREES
jgi:hypothetical protein